MGNLPRLGLFSSVQRSSAARYGSSTANASSAVLSLSTSDGRDDHVKLCNGIGRCDFSSGRSGRPPHKHRTILTVPYHTVLCRSCECPFGWGLDPDLGPCGQLLVNTSTWPGLARCPGLVNLHTASSLHPAHELGDRQNYPTRMFVSVNPTDHRQGQSAGNLTSSAIYHYNWVATVNEVSMPPATAVLVANLTSNSSAGPMVLDQAKNRIFFVDAAPAAPFIGVLYLPVAGSSSSSNHSVWLRLGYQVFGLAMDAHFKRRKLYWTYPGKVGRADGAIFWADMDAAAPAAHSLVAAIGQVARALTIHRYLTRHRHRHRHHTVTHILLTYLSVWLQSNIIDPHGIAVHYIQSKLYWVDRYIHNYIRTYTYIYFFKSNCSR